MGILVMPPAVSPVNGAVAGLQQNGSDGSPQDGEGSFASVLAGRQPSQDSNGSVRDAKPGRTKTAPHDRVTDDAPAVDSAAPATETAAAIAAAAAAALVTQPVTPVGVPVAVTASVDKEQAAGTAAAPVAVGDSAAGPRNSTSGIVASGALLGGAAGSVGPATTTDPVGEPASPGAAPGPDAGPPAPAPTATPTAPATADQSAAMGLATASLSNSGALNSGALNVGAPNSGAPNSGALNSGALNAGAPNAGALNAGVSNVGAATAPTVVAAASNVPLTSAPAAGRPVDKPTAPVATTGPATPVLHLAAATRTAPGQQDSGTRHGSGRPGTHAFAEVVASRSEVGAANASDSLSGTFDQPGTAQPGTAQPGTAQPGTDQPGTGQPALVQPGQPMLAAGQPVGSHRAAEPQPATVYTPATDAPLPQQLSGPVLNLRASGDGSHQLMIALHPADLGPVNVHVRIVGDAMTIAIDSTSETAHDAVRAALPQLRHELQSAGLTGVDVTLGSGSDSGSANNSAFGGFSEPGRRNSDHPPAQRYPGDHQPAPNPPRAPARFNSSGLDRWL